MHTQEAREKVALSVWETTALGTCAIALRHGAESWRIKDRDNNTELASKGERNNKSANLCLREDNGNLRIQITADIKLVPSADKCKENNTNIPWGCQGETGGPLSSE